MNTEIVRQRRCSVNSFSNSPATMAKRLLRFALLKKMCGPPGTADDICAIIELPQAATWTADALFPNITGKNLCPHHAAKTPAPLVDHRFH
jgi:hypothetical protein